MRYSRQNKIIELIESVDIDTQDRLSELLRESGFDVTQATISRDIKELQLVKTLTPSGRYKYAQAENMNHPITERFTKIVKETIQSVSSSGNIIIVKTLSGCASAAAEALDHLDYPHLLGSVAGDNTFFILIDDPENVPGLVARFREMID
ncbi:MAG: arginine repressor [Clostridiales Family XIII bacterium]|jgi:transcriptional regulator of arginine metabolism|nr:arginine repressor [Clostridiales Family XIII bacterium]